MKRAIPIGVLIVLIGLLPMCWAQVVNGDFETGDFSGWTVTGPHQAEVVQFQGSWCAHVHIDSGQASGQYSPNDQWEFVSQSLLVPALAESLNFYMEISGADWHDGGSVWIEDAGSPGVHINLFNSGSGGGSGHTYSWEYHQIDIRTWAEQNVTLYFGGHNFNGHADHSCDVYFDSVSLTLTVPDTTEPTVDVLVPNGGESYTAGEALEILWTAQDDDTIKSDNVFYSTDAGATWELVACHSGNPQSHAWVIPNTPSSECLMRVVACDDWENCACDESDSTFTIADDSEPPTVTLTSLNGGESLSMGAWHVITWESDDSVGVVGDSIYYSTDGGISWTPVIYQAGNPQSYNWRVPDTPSGECRIRVVVFDFCGNTATDVSDGDFTIFYQEARAITYAVVVKQSTYDQPDWAAVADTLIARYQGQLFVWNSSLSEVQAAVGAFRPTHIAFVCEALTASAGFVQNNLWPFTRALDADPYCDAVWGIVTGYNAEDAMRLSTCSGFTVKTVLGGTNCCDAGYFPQGIASSEGTYNRYSVKRLDSPGTVAYTDGPTDRTEWLINMINDGIEMFDNAPVDIFMTSGHGNHNEWQLHYPTSGNEGFFRSANGQLYGDPRSGPNINANSVNPKIYLALGNCYVGKIQSMNSMAPAWIHTGGACMMTGYVIPEGSDSHQHGGTKAFFARQGLYTWPESFFLANQNLYFDIQNQTPGTDPPDLNGSALYGNPALYARLNVTAGVIPGSMYNEEVQVVQGAGRDTVTVRITMNRQDSPGYNGKWGNRHPTVLFPFRADDVEIVSHNCLDVKVMDDFALLYVWYQGQEQLPAGATREVVFICNSTSGAREPVATAALPIEIALYGNYPNPFNPNTHIQFSLSRPATAELVIYNLLGQKIRTLTSEHFTAGLHEVIWDSRSDAGFEVPSGLYFCRLRAGDNQVSRRLLLLK